MRSTASGLWLVSSGIRDVHVEPSGPMAEQRYLHPSGACCASKQNGRQSQFQSARRRRAGLSRNAVIEDCAARRQSELWAWKLPARSPQLVTLVPLRAPRAQSRSPIGACRNVFSVERLGPRCAVNTARASKIPQAVRAEDMTLPSNLRLRMHDRIS